MKKTFLFNFLSRLGQKVKFKT
uniref:Uncharacterized protein n=1 Tax=Rhizophora mucronata TaxID=61149 RepID=A0A2P2LQM8_RHIMU